MEELCGMFSNEISSDEKKVKEHKMVKSISQEESISPHEARLCSMISILRLFSLFFKLIIFKTPTYLDLIEIILVAIHFLIHYKKEHKYRSPFVRVLRFNINCSIAIFATVISFSQTIWTNAVLILITLNLIFILRLEINTTQMNVVSYFLVIMFITTVLSIDYCIIVSLCVYSIYYSHRMEVVKLMKMIVELADERDKFLRIVENSNSGLYYHSPTDEFMSQSLLDLTNPQSHPDKNKTLIDSMKQKTQNENMKRNPQILNDKSWIKQFKLNIPMTGFPLNNFNSKSKYGYHHNRNITLDEVIMDEEYSYINDKGSLLTTSYLYLGLYTNPSFPDKLFEVYKTPYSRPNSTKPDTMIARKISFRLAPSNKHSKHSMVTNSMRKKSSSKVSSRVTISLLERDLDRSDVSVFLRSRSYSKKTVNDNTVRKDTKHSNTMINSFNTNANDHKIKVSRLKEIEANSEYVLIFTEVSALVRNQNDLAENKYKNIIMSKMAHEIKTPCIAINFFINSLEFELSKVLSKYDFECLVSKTIKIQTVTDQILILMNMISDYIRGIDKIALNYEEVNIIEQVRWGYWMFKGLLDTTDSLNKVKPVLKLPSSINEQDAVNTVLTDVKKLKIILSELLKNAVKYTKTGEISIELENPNTMQTVIRIKDSGIGFSKDKKLEIESLFAELETEYGKENKTRDNFVDNNISTSPVERANLSLFFLKGGLSLGLKVVKILCIRLNIGISFKSTRGNGSEFVLEINNRNHEFKLKLSMLNEMGNEIPEVQMDEYAISSKTYNSESDSRVNDFLVLKPIKESSLDAMTNNIKNKIGTSNLTKVKSKTQKFESRERRDIVFRSSKQIPINMSLFLEDYFNREEIDRMVQPDERLPTISEIQNQLTPLNVKGLDYKESLISENRYEESYDMNEENIPRNIPQKRGSDRSKMLRNMKTLDKLNHINTKTSNLAKSFKSTKPEIPHTTMSKNKNRMDASISIIKYSSSRNLQSMNLDHAFNYPKRESKNNNKMITFLDHRQVQNANRAQEQQLTEMQSYSIMLERAKQQVVNLLPQSECATKSQYKETKTATRTKFNRSKTKINSRSNYHSRSIDRLSFNLSKLRTNKNFSNSILKKKKDTSFKKSMSFSKYQVQKSNKEDNLMASIGKTKTGKFVKAAVSENNPTRNSINNISRRSFCNGDPNLSGLSLSTDSLNINGYDYEAVKQKVYNNPSAFRHSQIERIFSSVSYADDILGLSISKQNKGLKNLRTRGSFFKVKTDLDVENPESMILIVDDDSICLKSLKNVLKKILESLNLMNIKIQTASDGIEALLYIIEDQKSSGCIKLVISDENMNYINGSDSFMLLNKMFTLNKLNALPLVILTALEDEEALAYVQEYSGAHEILKKPVSRKMLGDLIEKVFVFDDFL